MEDKKNNTGLIILFTFLFGILIGVLISPESGSTTRSKIKYKFNDLLGNFKLSMEKFLDYLKKIKVSDCDQEGEKIVRETIDKADQIMNEI